MNARRIVLATALLVSALFFASAVGARTDPAGGTGGRPIAGSISVRVVSGESGDPIDGAFVMVGLYDGFPFDGNWGFTPPTGLLTFTDAALAGPATVTAGAAGFRYITLVSVDADDIVLPLDPIAAASPAYEVGDFVTGIDVNNGSFNLGDGNLDMAVVVPAMSAEGLMGFRLGGLFGPLDTLDVLGQPFEVPSNMFIPLQYEALTPIVKDHYVLDLPAGDYTLSALSGRISLQALLEAADITDVISHVGWRETDVLDVTVAGNTSDADLFVDPDLVQAVTLTTGNIPDGSTAWCISVGDLDGTNGSGRLAPLGIGSVACPAGSGPCGGTVTLTTTAPAGEFAGVGYFPAVAVESDLSEDVLIAMARGTHPQSYAETIDDFFRPLDLAYGNGLFSWSDAENPVAGSPPVDLQMARIESASGDSVYWEFLLPGGEHALLPPWLPPAAPPGPDEGAGCVWRHASIALDYDLPSFDFDAFSFSDIASHGAHLALDAMPVSFGSIATGTGAGVAPALEVLHENRPNPFNPSTSIRYDLVGPSTVNLSVYDAAGRRVTTLVDGFLDAGPHEAHWRGTDEAGRDVPSGVYFARLRANGFAATTKMTLVR